MYGGTAPTPNLSFSLYLSSRSLNSCRETHVWGHGALETLPQQKGLFVYVSPRQTLSIQSHTLSSTHTNANTLGVLFLAFQKPWPLSQTLTHSLAKTATAKWVRPLDEDWFHTTNITRVCLSVRLCNSSQKSRNWVIPHTLTYVHKATVTRKHPH